MTLNELIDKLVNEAASAQCEARVLSAEIYPEKNQVFSSDALVARAKSSVLHRVCALLLPFRGPASVDLHTYPLYCVDRQDRVSPEHQYRGPFATHDEAHEQAEPGDLVRRCRRVRATEIHGWESALGDLMEQLDERATSGELPDGAWGDFGDTIVEGQRDNLVDAMRAWLDEHVRVDAYICEGDE